MVHSGRRLLVRLLKFPCRGWQQEPVRGISAFVTVISVALVLVSSAVAQEQRAYREYSLWSSGAFANGHAFASTMDGRNYQLQARYAPLIYGGQTLRG